MGIKKFDKLVGIVGLPVSHSISPAMHNQAFLSLGLDEWCYLSMPVMPMRVKDAVLGLRALSFRGANVTVPHKEAVLPYMDELSLDAKAIGAVNTIVIDDGGQLIGHNTDGQGFINDLHQHKIDVKNMCALILGAGGSTRAVVHSLLKNGCKNIAIKNRTQSKSDDLANFFRVRFKDAKFSTDVSLESIKADLVVNTTSLGMNETKEEMPWDKNINFSSDQIVYDLIYNPRITTFLAHAMKSKAKIINGLGMLVHQGALSFELWTGRPAPMDIMKNAAEAAQISLEPALKAHLRR